MARADGRGRDELRPVGITTGVQVFAEGSAMIETGRTRVLCAVSVEDRVPGFLKGAGQGWITAEYGMLPRSTITRSPRDSREGGRAHEIQRLIGRSLRAVVDLERLGQRTLLVDCDVMQADGGTRTAAITGAYVALHEAVAVLVKNNDITSTPIRSGVAATSVAIVDGEVLLDPSYEEDYRASGDFNVVMTDQGELVEIQGTAEGKPFSRATLQEVLSLADRGMGRLFAAQREAIKGLGR